MCVRRGTRTKKVHTARRKKKKQAEGRKSRALLSNGFCDKKRESDLMEKPRKTGGGRTPVPKEGVCVGPSAVRNVVIPAHGETKKKRGGNSPF